MRMKTKMKMTLEQKLDRILKLLREKGYAPEEKVVHDESEQEAMVRMMFERMAEWRQPERRSAKFPVECWQGAAVDERMERVPLSALVNRCKARKCFATAEEVEKVVERLYEVRTLHDCGLRRHGGVKIALTAGELERILGVPFEDEGEEVPGQGVKVEARGWEMEQKEPEKPESWPVVGEETTASVVGEPAPKWSITAKGETLKAAYAPDEPLPPAEFPPDVVEDPDAIFRFTEEYVPDEGDGWGAEVVTEVVLQRHREEK